MAAVNITFLPLSNPLCNNDTCLAFEAAGDASQKHISWTSQFEYGKWVSYYYCGFVGIFALIYLGRIIQDHVVPTSRRAGEYPPTVLDKFTAVIRSLSYRRLKGKLGDSLGLPSLGITAFIVLSIIFAVLLTFIQTPYYRARRGYGSPPLGVRAGLAGTALTPIVFALAGKYNLVTLLTGISHEKLNVLHRWASYIYLFFGIAHTIPFLVADARDGGLHYHFYQAGSMEYTGIAPFVVLVFLCAFSAYWLRRQFYWLFAKTHILASIAFLGTMFWHCADSGNSWYYLWATLAIMIIQWGARAFAKTTIFEMTGGDSGGWRRAGEVELEILEGDMVKLKMQVALRWKPGQHVFLRIPEFGMFNNHPFTITSICPDNLETKHEAPYKLNEMTFLVRPYRGLTKRLMSHNGAPPYGMIDGPYGGIARPLQMLYDSIVLVGGGGGISALLPWVADLSLRMSRDADAIRLSHVSLIWCVRHPSAISWVDSELRDFARWAPAGSVSVLIFVTGPEDEGVSSSAVASQRDHDLDEKATDAENLIMGDMPFAVQYRRPFLPDVLSSTLRGGKLLYVGCGPEGMKTDLSNFAASAQKEVLKGRCTEVALHTETFDW